MSRKTYLFIALVALILGGMPHSASAVEPHAFPVPFVATRHPDIKFIDLPGAGQIRIFTLTGEKVVEISIPPATGLVSWNVKNSAGENVSTGVYFYEVDAGGSKTTGKIVVIR